MKIAIGITNKKQKITTGKEMGNMKPGEVCVIDDDRTSYNGDVVMRVPSENVFLVTSLSRMKEGDCWDCKNDIIVIPFHENSITIQLKDE